MEWRKKERRDERMIQLMAERRKEKIGRRRVAGWQREKKSESMEKLEVEKQTERQQE